MEKVLISNIGMLATPLGRGAQGGKAQGNIRILKDAWFFIADGITANI